MKRKLQALKSATKTKKFFGKNTMLTVVALLLLVALMITATYSWVESVSSIVIENKTASGASGTENVLRIEDRLKTTASINPTGTGSIDLSQYFRAAGNVHMAAAQSANGEDIFFYRITKAAGSNTASPSYRKGTVNDKNVNYYDFTFTIKLASGAPKDFVFGSVPTFKYGASTNTTFSNKVRCAIKLDSNPTKVYSNNASTAAVVSGLNGTSSITSAEATQTFSSGVTTPIFTISDTNTHTINVKLWYQGTLTSANYLGKSFVVENFVLKPQNPVYTITAYSLTNGTNNTTAGGVSKDNSTFASSVQVQVEAGSRTYLYAKAPATSYEFEGWSETATGSIVSTSRTYQIPTVTATSSKTYYARYKTQTFNVCANSVVSGTSTVSTTGGTVRISSPTSIATSNASTTGSKTVNYNTSVTFVATAATNYVFEGWYSAATGGSLVNSSASFTVAVTNTNYANIYARFKATSLTTTIYFEPISGFSSYNHWIYTTGGGNYSYNGKNQSYSNEYSWPGAAATFDTATGYYKYTFTSTESATTPFSMIVSNNGVSQKDPVTGYFGKTYVYKYNGTLVERDPAANNEICIVLKDGTSNSWLNNDTPTFTIRNSSSSYTMTRIDDDTWYAIVPKTFTSVRFSRATYNYWPTSSTYMNRSATNFKYTATSDGYGNWSQSW